MRSRKSCWLVPAVFLVGVCIGRCVVARAADTTAPTGKYHVVKELHIGGEGGWDYVTVDPESGRLYVPRGNHTQIIDVQSGKVISDLADTTGVHGVALAPTAKRGYTSNGRSNTVSVFDLETNKVLGTAPTSEGPDAIIYDPASNCVFCFDGRAKDATVISVDAPLDKAVTAHIPLDGRPESAVSDGQGHVYDDLEDKSQIAVIDTKTMKVTATWDIAGGDGPAGLAIDVAGHHLFAGCHNQVMAILDTQTGKTLGTVPIGSGVDFCAFDPATGEVFASCGDGTLTVVKETSPGKFESVQTVQTPKGARTLALDTKTHTLYLPTAEFEPLQAGERRPKAKAGTFKIVVVSGK
ncbi:MAG: YncE family protein [Tepidisphaeraceae bacterium]